MEFDLHPYVGALPIEFGMARAEVHRLVGSPESVDPVWDGSGSSEHYSGAVWNVGYDLAGRVVHVGIGPGAVALRFMGTRLWTATEFPDPNPTFLAADPDPVDLYGILVFPRIGITTSGYHDDDPAQLAVCVFPRGAFDARLPNGKPPDLNRYRSA